MLTANARSLSMLMPPGFGGMLTSAPMSTCCCPCCNMPLLLLHGSSSDNEESYAGAPQHREPVYAAFTCAMPSLFPCGCAGLSTYLPLRNEEGVINPANAKTPIFQAHGDADQVVGLRGGTAKTGVTKIWMAKTDGWNRQSGGTAKQALISTSLPIPQCPLLVCCSTTLAHKRTCTLQHHM